MAPSVGLLGNGVRKVSIFPKERSPKELHSERWWWCFEHIPCGWDTEEEKIEKGVRTRD